jgi:hypothetical protein
VCEVVLMFLIALGNDERSKLSWRRLEQFATYPALPPLFSGGMRTALIHVLGPTPEHHPALQSESGFDASGALADNTLWIFG